MQANQPFKLAVLVSGNGSNLQAIIDYVEAGEIHASIACVISNIPDAYALTRAAKHGIPAIIHEGCRFTNRREYDRSLVEILKSHEVELVVLAGFMRILTEVMIDAFQQRIINIHPALLPAFPGLNAQQQALDYGVRFSGCTVHFVDHGTDTGPIILQAVVPVMQDDTVDQLSQRILKEEHKLFPQAIKLLVDHKISLHGRRVLLEH
ncbi:MAG: phosphoribosylglycinamide formyltransferase [Desulfuromonadales bacterium]|nr:phosphoribosylglycinamide formyltransferase [Desulfuromonadales bacterium]